MAQNIKTFLRFNPYYMDASSWDSFAWDRFELKFEKLSPLLKDILISAKTSLFIEEISAQMRLNISQGQGLSRIIRDIVLADIYLGDTINIIQNKLGIDKDSAKDVANLFISQLSKEALEELKKLHVERFGQRQPQASQLLTEKPENTNNPNVIDLRDKP